MEEAGAGSGAASSSSTTLLSGGGRLRFEVELTPGETTIVSWKKLMKDANKAAKNKNDNEVPHVSAPSAPVPVDANPTLDSRIAPRPILEMLLKMKQTMHPLVAVLALLLRRLNGYTWVKIVVMRKISMMFRMMMSMILKICSLMMLN